MPLVGDYNNTIPRITWGTNYDKAIDFGYPLDELVVGDQSMDGSEFVKYQSGLEDAWITGDDNWLNAMWRWVPQASQLSPRQSGFDGDDGVRAFLRHARNKNVLRFFPDSRNLITAASMNVTYPSTYWNHDSIAGASVSVVNNDSALKVSTSGGGSTAGYITQTVYGIMPGESLSLSVEHRWAGLTGSPSARVALEFYTSAGVYISEVNSAFGSQVGYARSSVVTGTAPADTARVNCTFYSLINGGAGTSDIWWKNAVLARRSADAAAYLDNPHYDVYLHAPWSMDDASRDDDGTRKFRLRLRTVTDTPILGY